MGRDLVVTSGHVVAFGVASAEEGAPGIVGEAYDLETGEVSEVKSPAGDQFLVNEAGALDGSVIVGGVTCRSLVFVDNDPDQCAEQTQSFRLEPGSGTWEVLRVPEGWSSMSIVQSGVEGTVLATFRTNDRSVQQVAVLNGDSWEPVVELPDRTYSTVCATSEVVYRLAGDMAGDPLSGIGPEEYYGIDNPVGWSVERISFDGAVEVLDAPDLEQFFGLAAVQLACAEDGPLLLSTAPEEPTVLYRGDGSGGWEVVEGGIGTDGPAIVGDVLSSSSGPAAVAWLDRSSSSEPGAVVRGVVVLVDGDGSLRELPGDTFDHLLDRRRGYGEVVAIGPLSQGHETDPGGVVVPESMQLWSVEGEG